MLDIKWVGGSEADRKRIAEQHDNYLTANATFDWPRLPEFYSGADFATFFNLNGHTYNGREPWTKLWQYYQPRMKTGYWTPKDMTGVISGDLAVVWCHRDTKSEWVGKGERPVGQREKADFESRSTMVFMREGDEWRTIHVHFSESKAGDPRPGEA